MLNQIELDVTFLMKQRFMDYSLLMAVKRVGKAEDEVINKKMDFEDDCKVEDHTQIDDFAQHQKTFHARQSIDSQAIK